MTKTITAVFNTREEADAALRSLEKEGYTKDQITMLISKETRGKHFSIVEGSKAEEGAAAGAALGGLAGALYMALASAGTVFIPGLNLVASGALVGGLAGLGAGAATGGLIGALIGLGIPEHEARLYDEKVRGGAILIAIEVYDEEKADRVENILRGANAQSVTALAA
jgi:hypothetical protein